MTDPDGVPTYDDAELTAEFAALFPHGWAGPDVMRELAPDGWANSPLAAVFHPTVEQVYGETLQMHRGLANLGRRPDAPPPPPEPTPAEIAAEHEETPVEPEREVRELVGQCLWDVFSDNHEVVAADGRRLDLGSMRRGGGFLAEVLNAQGGPPPPARAGLGDLLSKFMAESGSDASSPHMAEMIKEMTGDGGYSYLDFYLGTHLTSGRADLLPVYAMIFRRLRGRGLDWVYHFPRLYAVDFRPLKKALDERERGGEPEWAGYDPSRALAEEQDERQHDEEVAELRASLDEGHREAVEAARDQPPPATVRAYEAVYGQFPAGWPPEA